MNLVAFVQGLGIGGGLVVVIGAQGAFLLSQSIRREYAGLIASLCAVSDLLLILVGVYGFAAALNRNPQWLTIATQLGALFLFGYGLLAFRRVWSHQKGEAYTGVAVTSTGGAVMTTLALTFLNPQVYLDTIVLLGSISGFYPPQERILFAAGAVTASILWFGLLYLAGRPLSRLLRGPASWKVIDTLVGVTMWSIGGSLLLVS